MPVQISGIKAVQEGWLNREKWQAQKRACLIDGATEAAKLLSKRTPINSGITYTKWRTKNNGNNIDVVNDYEVRGKNVVAMLLEGTPAHIISPLNGGVLSNINQITEYEPFRRDGSAHKGSVVHPGTKPNDDLVHAWNFEATYVAMNIISEDVVGFFIRKDGLTQLRNRGGGFGEVI